MEVKSIPIRTFYNNAEPMTPVANLNFSAELKKVIHERNILTTRTKKRVFDDLDEINNETIEDSKKRKKESALYEILSTEKSYIHQLEVIKTFFMTPILERDLLKPQDFAALFSNIHTIFSINNELLQELYKGSGNVANAFSKIAPFFKLYSLYACEFKIRLKVLQDSQMHNAKFAKFLEMQESRPEVQSKLSALLIAPIQRVPRYTLLLKKLLNLASPFDKDYKSLRDSLSKVQDAANHINKIVDEQENMQRLVEVQRYLSPGEPKIIVPGRRLIKEGVLSKISRKNSHSERIYVVLMSDIIMFCKMKKDEPKSHSMKCSNIFPLNKSKVVDVLDKGCFKITCQDDEIVLYNKQLDETKYWIRLIKESIVQHVADRKTLRKDNSSRRPVKRKDVQEYNEVGISPGKRLKKRRTLYMEGAAATALLGGKTVVEEDDEKLEAEKNNTVSPLFITLKPNVTLNEADKPLTDKENFENVPENNSGKNSVFIFGMPHPSMGFTFSCGKFFNSVGTSLKKMFRFK